MEVPPFLCLSGGRCAQGPRACGRGAIVGGAVRRSCFPDEIFSARISGPGGRGGSFFPALTRGRLNPCVFAFGVAGDRRRDGHPPALILVPILSFARSGSCVSTVFSKKSEKLAPKFPGQFFVACMSFPRACRYVVRGSWRRGHSPFFAGAGAGLSCSGEDNASAASCRIVAWKNVRPFRLHLAVLLFLGRPMVWRMPPPLGRFRGRRLPAPSLGRAAVGLEADFGSRIDSRPAVGAVPGRFRKMGHVPFPGGVVLRRAVVW